MLVGCSAGFLNTAKIKGTHAALKSGMLAGEAIVESMQEKDVTGEELYKYYLKFQKSWLWD